jgi:transcriptional regulator with XRE-family HTH domain
MSDKVVAKTRLKMTPGDAVRVTRGLQEMTQGELAAASGVPQPAISSIESGRSALGVDRAERIARALHVHPAVLLWPSWEPASLIAAEPIDGKIATKPLKHTSPRHRIAAKKMRPDSHGKRISR